MFKGLLLGGILTFIGLMYAECLPNAKFQLLEAKENRPASHFVFDEQPDEFARHVARFLSTAEQAAGSQPEPSRESEETPK